MYKFIEFANTIVNTKYIGKICKADGINAQSGKYAVTMVLDGFENLTEWFSNKTERGTRYYELFNILTEKS